MRPTARTIANRRNSRRSTGPKTVAGKSEVAQNALRHGLEVPADRRQTQRGKIEELTVLIAGDGANETVLDRARKVAEAQFDLLRVRRARLSLLSNPKERVEKVRLADLRRALKNETTRRLAESDALNEGRSRDAGLPTLEEALPVLAEKLISLDRYERRALSRRKRAIQEFDGLALDRKSLAV
jgi:hypothetical protein